MTDYNWCHGPDCHTKHTQSRVRGSKGNKVLRTIKIKHSHWNNQDRFNMFNYFCNQSCLMEPKKRLLIGEATHIQILRLRLLTMLDLSYMFKDMTDIKIKTTNPFSGESIMLTQQESDMYNGIMIAQVQADEKDGDDPLWQVVRDGLTWFQKNNAKAYMVLLD